MHMHLQAYASFSLQQLLIFSYLFLLQAKEGKVAADVIHLDIVMHNLCVQYAKLWPHSDIRSCLLSIHAFTSRCYSTLLGCSLLTPKILCMSLQLYSVSHRIYTKLICMHVATQTVDFKQINIGSYLMLTQ